MRKFLLSFAALIIAAATWAQPVGQGERMPVDPDVRIGVLDNGMTYYIRHNAKPANMGEFHIVHNVGAIQEEDSQVGLAHFLEHLAFNGTKNLPGKTMIEWLETVGVKFGSNLNASTGVERTTYMLSQVPLTRESIVDSALLILHDWSHFIALKDEEIDNERGVIVEELRQGNNAGFRVMMQTMPMLYGGTRYGHRNIIGNEEQLRTFPYEALREFYSTWYRPDLQAIIAIGDFDVDKIEAKIKNLMADIPAPVNPARKEFFAIPDNVEPMVQVVTDPELTGSGLSYFIKHPGQKTEDMNLVSTAYENTLEGAACAMLNARFGEIAVKPNAPFIGASIAVRRLGAMNRVLNMDVDSKDNELVGAFEAAYTEVERTRRFGFTEQELSLLKTNLLSNNEAAYAARDDRRSAGFVGGYTGHFTLNAPILSAEQSYEMNKRLIEQITLAQIDEAFRKLVIPTNNLLFAQTPAKEGVTVPKAEELTEVLEKVRQKELEPYSQEAVDGPLVPANIKAGKVKKVEQGVFDSEIWTLSNGVKVVVRPSDLSANSVTMTSYARGGVSMIPDQDYRTATTVVGVAGASGLGDFTNVQLSRRLAGKKASAGPAISRFSSGVGGSSTTGDIETMLQLVYLDFTAPRFDREQFDRIMEQTRVVLENSKDTPQTVFQRELNKTVYGAEAARAQPLSPANIGEIEFDKMAGIYDKFFKGTAANYTFYFVGDFDKEVLKPLVEKYIGGLPVDKKKKLAIKDDGMERRTGEIINRFETKMEAPKSTVYYTYAGEIEYTLENNLLISLLSDCLDRRYFEEIREKEGGTYGVGVAGALYRQPKSEYELRVMFDTDPASVDKLSAIVDAELRKIAENGPLAEDMNKTLEFWYKIRPENLRQNSTWLNYIQNYYIWGEDWNTIWEETVASITPEKVQAMAQRVLENGNKINIVMSPALSE